MHKRIEIGGRTFEVRGLKRREVKALRAGGFRPGNVDAENADDYMDKVFELIGCDLSEVDDLEYAEAMEIFKQVMEMTFIGEGERKNSSSPAGS